MSSVENISIQLTQSTLGKYVTKPNLSEKLLKKPPFRFLHDIICVVVNDTDYLKGLFTDDELVSANVKEREAKVAFLNKLISAVKATSNADLKVRASKIIAGLEPIETNKLLQAIATAIEQKTDCSDYVKSLRNGAPKGKTVSKVSKTSSNKDKIKETKDSSKSSDNSKLNTKSNPKEKSTPKELQSSTKSTSKASVHEKKVREKKTIERKSSKDSISSTDRKERKYDASKSKILAKVPTKVSPKEQETKPSKTIETIIEDKILMSQEPTDISNNRINNELLLNQQSDDTQPLDKEDEIVHSNEKDIVEIKAATERPKTAKIAKSMTQLIKDNSYHVSTPDTVEQPEKQVTQQSQVIANNITTEPITAKPRPPTTVIPHSRPRSSLRPPTARPGTARPAAPRLRPPSALRVTDTVVASGNVKVVVEQCKVGKDGHVEDDDDDDDEETVVVQENVEDQSSATTIANSLEASASVAAASKSHLVGQIMAQVGQQDGKSTAVQVQLFQADKPVAELGVSIQTVTQSANTLGQLMGYLHEDIDAMRAELEHWSQVARTTMAAADKRRTELTERTQPLRIKLQEVEDEIQRQKEEIAALQCTIYTDQGRIDALLHREVEGLNNGGAVPIYD